MEPTLPELISGALRLDRAAFDAIEQSSHGLRDAFIVLVLAGASITLGHSVVLFLNRVSPGRFRQTTIRISGLFWRGMILAIPPRWHHLDGVILSSSTSAERNTVLRLRFAVTIQFRTPSAAPKLRWPSSTTAHRASAGQCEAENAAGQGLL
jgi:hypothetical protein